MYLIRKKLKDFSAAHRLIKNYQGPCAHLHGHNYVATVLVGMNRLNAFGFVIDFSEIKKICDDWLEQHIDHASIISSDDQALIDFVIQHQQKHYIIPNGKNTTAEVLAEHLFEKFSTLLNVAHPDLILFEVEVAETVTSKAIYRCHSPERENPF